MTLRLSGQRGDDQARQRALPADRERSRGIRERAYAKQLVYYDGPTDDDQVCGQGGGSADGSGVAMVYLANCTDVPTAAVAAHELLHAFGALASSGPPHACPDTRDHPCDSEADILYPYAGTSPLTSLVLDVGRNDYYGHSGAWLDVQDSSVVAARQPPGRLRARHHRARLGRERPAGDRLRGELHDRVGRGNDRLARGASRRRGSGSSAGRERAAARSPATWRSRRRRRWACCSRRSASGSSSPSAGRARSPAPAPPAASGAARVRRRRTCPCDCGRRRRRAGGSPAGPGRAAGARPSARCR